MGEGAHRPRRSLGQNFLVDGNLRRRIVEEARIHPDETVLEIGPGTGALTEGLAAQAGRLVLVELDRELAGNLARRFADDPSVTVIQDDILHVPLTRICQDPSRLKVVGNIPYNLTTPILFHLLERPRPAEILLMVQREVADRIMSPPGSREYGALSVGVQAVGRVERVLSVPPEAFRPRPRVESTVIRILPLVPAPLNPTEEGLLRRLTRALFQWRRKQLRKILRDHPDLAAMGLGAEGLEALLQAARAEPTDRPETVSPEGFVAMARYLAKAVPG
jgi:16S rRNA (adenine1518-N6/adenine1519-N6)-dimethyltransferase